MTEHCVRKLDRPKRLGGRRFEQASVHRPYHWRKAAVGSIVRLSFVLGRFSGLLEYRVMQGNVRAFIRIVCVRRSSKSSPVDDLLKNGAVDPMKCDSDSR